MANMTIKNIPLLYLTFVFLSATYPSHSFPLPDDVAAKPVMFEPPREMLVAVNDNSAPAVVQNTDPSATGATPVPASEPAPTQAIVEKLANTGTPEATPSSTDSPSVASAPVTHAVLQAVQSPAAPTPSPTQDSPLEDDLDLGPPDFSTSDPALSDEVDPTITLPVNPVSTDASLAPYETSESIEPTATPAPLPTTSVAQFFSSYSSNLLATRTSYRTTATITPVVPVPLPSQGPPGESEVTKRSRRTAVVGSLMAVGLVMAFVGFIFCFRCQCCRRKKATTMLDLLAEEHEKESLSPNEKGFMSPGTSPIIPGITVPILRSHMPHTVTFADPLDQQEWRLVATNHEGSPEDFTHVVIGESFMDIDLNSHSDMRISGASEEDNIPSGSSTRASAGAASTGAQSYSTRASMYSDQSGQPMRASASFDKLNQLASLATSPTSPSRPRQRSKTVTSAPSPSAAPMKATKSLPSVTSYDNRFSNESTRSRTTTRSGDSEWDVAQAYGAPRYSKESAGGGSFLSTISEATTEGMEAVEVGGKQCVLMKSKF